MAIEVFMPKMSDHMEYGEIIRWLVEEGDEVEQGQVILELMTDKAVVEFEAPASGVIVSIREGAIDGATIPVGETFAFIAEHGEDVPVLPPFGPIQDLGLKTEENLIKEAANSDKEISSNVRASPLARQIAKELGIQISQVKGTGAQGRITDKDVRNFFENTKAEINKDPSEGNFKWMDLTPFQQITGERMLESMQTMPQFTLSVNVDMTNAVAIREYLLEQVRREIGEYISITVFIVKAVAASLRRYPIANASFESGRIKLHSDINIGVAIGTDKGLIVPIIRNADKKTLQEITKELKGLKDKSARMRLSTSDLNGGTFTISNLGMYGIDKFNAIINPPESGILAVGRIIKTPIGTPEDRIELRPMMTLSLTVDHRCMDGVQAAMFLVEIKTCIEDKTFFIEE